MNTTDSGLLILVAAVASACAQPTGTWIGCSWEGTPAAINEIVVWDPDGSGPLAAAPFLATDGGIVFKDTDGTIRNFGGFDTRTSALTVWDPDGPGPASGSLIAAFQSEIFGPTNFWALVPQPGGEIAGQFLGGFDGGVRSLATYDTDGDGFDELVAAGEFENLVGGDPPTPMIRTAVLDGNTWTQLGTAPDATCTVVESVPCEAGNSAFACDGDSTLMVGGFFTQAGGQAADALACWDAQSNDWRPCDQSSGLAGTTVVRALTGWDIDGSATDLVVGGFSILVDGADAGNLAHLDAGGWSPLADGFFGNIEALTTFDVDGDGEPELIAATVVSEGGQFPFQIRYWDGGAWRLLDGGEIVAGGFTQVKDYLSFDADGPGGVGLELIIVGSFSSATIAGVSGIDHLAVWVPDSTGGPCNDADLVEPFGELDFFDLQAYLNLYSAGDPGADLNGDGLIDFFDVQAFLNAFAGGCP
jgi:hypothetical protein